MREGLRIGLVATSKSEVTEEMLAKNVGSGDTAVLATPMMLNLMETLCAQMIGENLEEEDLTSVGTLANITHIAPTPKGMQILIKATVIGLDRRRVTFRVEVRDDMEMISSGIHERVIVSRTEFEKKAYRKRP